jgi:hypothetical protein
MWMGVSLIRGIVADGGRSVQGRDTESVAARAEFTPL